MGHKYSRSPWLSLKKNLLLCISLVAILSLPYLFFWGYPSKPNVSKREALRNEKLLMMFANLSKSSNSSKDESTSYFANSSFRTLNSANKPHESASYVNSAFKTFSNENKPAEQELGPCHPSKAYLRVFMYDLPSEFHFGLMDWKSEGSSVWPDLQTKVPSYPGGLNVQHSIEYWLTLDILSSTLPGRNGPCSAVRVKNYIDADVVFVPFFSSLSYNRHSKIEPPEKVSRNMLLQQKLVNFLQSREEWKKSGGRDHVILAHHPNSMLESRSKLSPGMFILSDFGRYSPQVANVEKDIIAPYKHVIKTFINDSSGYDDRPTLLYFQGAIHRKDGGTIREDLYRLLRKEKDVHFAFGSVSQNGVKDATRGMHSSKYCLNIAGDTPSSNRLFDAIASHCVPVIISDEIELPFEDVLDYSQFCVFVRKHNAVKKGFLIKLVKSIKREQWTQMWQKLKEVEKYYEFQYPSKKDDAIQMIWQAVARKLPAARLKLHRSRRFSWYNNPR